jgi:hypothetical protein
VSKSRSREPSRRSKRSVSPRRSVSPPSRSSSVLSDYMTPRRRAGRSRGSRSGSSVAAQTVPLPGSRSANHNVFNTLRAVV